MYQGEDYVVGAMNKNKTHMDLSDDSELRSWLLSHGYSSESTVFSNVLSMCDTLEDLKSLQWEDIESHMPTVKVGARRTLMTKIDSLKSAGQSQAQLSNNESESKANSLSSSSQNVIARTNTDSIMVVSATQRAKVDELLSKSKNRAQPAVAPPKPMNSDRRGIGEETKALLAQRANAAATAALVAFKANAAVAKAVPAKTVNAEVAEAATESAGIPFVSDVESASGASSTAVEVGRQGVIDRPSTGGGKVPPERLISGDRLDLLIPNCDAVEGGSADPSVAYFFSSSMDSAALTTKELDENKSMNACSGGHDACFKARAAFLEERLRLVEGKLANAEEKIGVLQLELEESIFVLLRRVRRRQSLEATSEGACGRP